MWSSETVPQDAHTKFVLVLKIVVELITCHKLELTIKTNKLHTAGEAGKVYNLERNGTERNGINCCTMRDVDTGYMAMENCQAYES